MANNTTIPKAVSNEMIALEGGGPNVKQLDMTNSKAVPEDPAGSDDEMGVRHCFYDFCKQTILHGWHYLADIEHDNATPNGPASFVTFTPVSSPLALTASPNAQGHQPLLLHHNNHSSHRRSRSSSPVSRSRSNSHHHVTLNARASGSGHANVSITHHHHCCSCRGHDEAGQVVVPGGATMAGPMFSEDPTTNKKAVVAERFLCCCPIEDSAPTMEAVEATNDDSRMR